MSTELARPLGTKGALGWCAYADVLPYFKQFETWERGEKSWHSRAGRTELSHRSVYDAWLEEKPPRAAAPVTDDYNSRSRKASAAVDTPSITAAMVVPATALAAEPPSQSVRALATRVLMPGHARDPRGIA